MARTTTPDDLTREQIESAYEVLEVLREKHESAGRDSISTVLNEAHYFVQMYEQNARWIQDFDVPNRGEIVRDTENNPRYGSGDVEVVEVLSETAREHWISCQSGEMTVARKNPDHPENAPVVKGKYVDGSDKEYAFPVTRLE